MNYPFRNMKEPCSLVASKVDPDNEFIFSPIISAQLDTINKHRPSIISLKIKGEGMEEGMKLSAIRRYAGVLFALFATFSYSLATLILKLFQKYHPFTVSIWRFQGNSQDFNWRVMEFKPNFNYSRHDHTFNPNYPLPCLLWEETNLWWDLATNRNPNAQEYIFHYAEISHRMFQ